MARIFNLLEALFVTTSVCGPKQSVLSRTTPSSRGVGSCLITFPSITIDGDQLASRVLVEKKLDSHLSAFRDSFHSLLQVATMSTKACASFSASALSLFVARRVTSSAKNAACASGGISSARLLTNKMNRRGDRTQPCGSPCFMSLVLLVELAKLTRARLSERKAFSHLMYCIGMFFWCRLSRSF